MDIEKTGQGSAEPAGVGVAPSLLHAADAVSLAKYYLRGLSDLLCALAARPSETRWESLEVLARVADAIGESLEGVAGEIMAMGRRP